MGLFWYNLCYRWDIEVNVVMDLIRMTDVQKTYKTGTVALYDVCDVELSVDGFSTTPVVK